jgi:hypothetical protein
VIAIEALLSAAPPNTLGLLHLGEPNYSFRRMPIRYSPEIMAVFRLILSSQDNALDPSRYGLGYSGKSEPAIGTAYFSKKGIQDEKTLDRYRRAQNQC